MNYDEDTMPDITHSEVNQDTSGNNNHVYARRGLIFSIILFVLTVSLFVEPPEKKLSFREGADIEEAIQSNPFADLEINARAALVFDIQRGEALYNSQEEVQLPLASLTKIMTVLLAEETLPPDTIVTVDKDALNKEGDSGLLLGERWKFSDLIDLTLVASSNDGAHALAKAVMANLSLTNRPDQLLENNGTSFSSLMNVKAGEIGMRQTFFINESGLDAHEAVGGAYGSARDLSLLLAYVIQEYPKLFEATTLISLATYSLDGEEHRVENTNEFVESIPGIIASKTGTTDLAGGNLAVVFEIAPLHPIAVIVLGSTPEKRFSDVQALVGATIVSFLPR